MSDPRDFPKMRSIVEQRVASLLGDGYFIMFQTHDPVRYFIRLRHASNGSFISLFVDYEHNLMRQLTNGVIKHESEIWKKPASVV